jgi:hypothetical protein
MCPDPTNPARGSPACCVNRDAVQTAAWHQKRSWALVATRDRNINPDLERTMAKRAGSATIEVAASHAVYASKPEDVARLIERAAKASAQ